MSSVVVEFLASRGVAVVAHRHPPVRHEADLHLTGLDPAASIKTLAFCLADDTLVLVGVPGPWRVRYAAIARALGVPRSQLRPASAERLAAVGLEPGGVSPICADPTAILLLDEVVPGMGRVYCGGGTPELTLELDSADLGRIAHRPLFAVISEPPDDASR